MIPALSTEFVFNLAIRVAAPIEVGDLGYGAHRVIPIVGGELIGERLRRTIRQGGADCQIIRPNGFTELEARYVVEMDEDRRSHTVMLTDKGRSILARAKRLVGTKHEARLNTLFGEADRAALFKILDKLVRF